jgi:2,3-bisphosphoglycerate-independent phosphoglycerate mutase
VKKSGGTLHLLGLIGKGGVHGVDTHLYALLDLAEREGLTKVAIHALMDGRDTLPTSGLGYMQETLAKAKGRARVASLGGRYFGMDRDKRWDRTEKFYRAAVDGVAPAVRDPIETIKAAYESGVTDEFIPPVTVVDDAGPVAPMRDGDAVICFNYRSDRMRQIVRALTLPDFDGFDVSKRPALHVVTMTQYDQTFDLPVAFAPQSMARIVAEVVSGQGMTMFRTAETEKYAHVTYFFNGGVEPPYPGEERLLVQSQKVATYDLAPEMSAHGVTDVLCGALDKGDHDFVLCNYANGDMVGHTGNLEAAKRAIEVLDECIGEVVKAMRALGGEVLITADHGNAEMMADPATHQAHTAHTLNVVPLLYIGRKAKVAEGGALQDVAPTLLAMMGLPRPSEMTGKPLVRFD